MLILRRKYRILNAVGATAEDQLYLHSIKKGKVVKRNLQRVPVMFSENSIGRGAGLIIGIVPLGLLGCKKSDPSLLPSLAATWILKSGGPFSSCSTTPFIGVCPAGSGCEETWTSTQISHFAYYQQLNLVGECNGGMTYTQDHLVITITGSCNKGVVFNYTVTDTLLNLQTPIPAGLKGAYDRWLGEIGDYTRSK